MHQLLRNSGCCHSIKIPLPFHVGLYKYHFNVSPSGDTVSYFRQPDAQQELQMKLSSTLVQSPSGVTSQRETTLKMSSH